MIKIKKSIFAITLALALLVGLADTADAANLTYSSDTDVYISNPGYTLTIKSGSTATTAIISTTALRITMPISSTFTLASRNNIDITTNSGAATTSNTCSGTTNTLVITTSASQTPDLTLTPNGGVCASSSGGGNYTPAATPTTTTTTTTTPTTTTATTTTTPTTTPTAPATTTPAATTPATTVSYPDGTLLKSSADPKVYVIKNGEKVWIQTASEFTKAGYKWTDVKTVSVDVIKQVGAVTLLRAEGDPRVYVVKNNVKRHITSSAEFASAGYSWSDVQVVAKSQVDAYATATAITVKVVNTPTLRVRASNTTASGILGKVSQNETFTVLEEKGSWYKVTTKTGVTGWVSGAYAVKQ